MEEFKKIIKDRIKFDPVFSPKDQEIWVQLNERIAEYEAAKHSWKKYYPLMAAALLLLGFSLVFLLMEDKKPTDSQLANQKKSQPIEMRSVDSMVSLPEEKIVAGKHAIKEEKKGVSKPEMPKFVLEKESHIVVNQSVEYHDLSEGTLFVLDKGSSLAYNPDYLQNRQVLLKGQGYFEVKPDANHPFKVYFGNTHLVVLGTKFYVQNINDKNYSVQVTEGKVKVYSPVQGNYTELVKGQELSFNGHGDMKVREFTNNNIGSWKKACLKFNDTPLSKVFYTLSKESGKPIHCNSQIGACLFSGDLSEMVLSEALNFIKITANLAIEEKDEHLYISGNSCD